MKFVGVFCLLLIASSLAACGGGESSGAAPEDVVVWRKGKPVALVALADRGRPPKKLIVKDVEVGAGKLLKDGSTGTFRFRSFDYRTGQRYEDWWGRPFVTGFGKGESLGAWETGLKGMRVGGRRELIVPAKEAYTHVPVLYAIELVDVY